MSGINRMNEGTDLTQGQELIGYTREHVRVLEPHLRELQLSSSPGLTSIVEALGTMESVNAQHVDSKDKISALEERFNMALGEYARTNDQINELLLRRHHKGLDTYNGMIVTTDGDKSFVYVNDYGFTHKYPRESPHAKQLLDKSCEALKRDKINKPVLDRMLRGHDMVPGEPCGVAGKNVSRGQTDEHAWISIDGLKHVYPSHVWHKKSMSCDVPVITLDEAAYDAIPSGSAMTTSTDCERGAGVPPALWDRLYKLNDELAHLTNLLSKEVNGLVATDMVLMKKLADQKEQLAQHMDSLGEDRTQIRDIQQQFRTVVGANENSRLLMMANWTHYVIWVLLATVIVGFVIVGFVIHTNEPGQSSKFFVLIAMLVTVYIWTQNR
jgi:hypothetical protein